MTRKIKSKGTSARKQKRKQSAGRPVLAPSAIFQQALSLHQAGRLSEAETLYRQILLTEPNHPEALHYLGVLAHQVGKNGVAEELISKALHCRPDYVDARVNLGTVFKAQGTLDKAVVSFRHALELQPDHPEALNNLGIALHELGKLDAAAASFRRVLCLKPDYVKGYINLGTTLKAQGKVEEAIAIYRRALTVRPDHIDVLNNLGNALQGLGKLEEAVDSYRRLLSLEPDFAGGIFNLANVLQELGRLDEAVDGYQQALALRPDFVEAYNNLGMTLHAQGNFEEAIASYRRALALKPDFVEAHSNLGNALLAQGNLNGATSSCLQAFALKPDYLGAHSNLLLYMNYLPGQSPSHYLAEARHFGRKATARVRAPFTDWICPPHPERLRVGMVSGDFRNHPVGYFLENILANIDPKQIELIAYPTNRGEDALTARLRSRFVAWKPLAGLHDEAAARLIHDDGVHVLLDLSGHTRANRLPVVAWKPAPVQATWLGYFASTGMAEMDYLIADSVSVPESHQVHFTEKIWYLPETRVCFSPPGVPEELPITPLPALQNGYVTFGCFQNLAKLNDKVLEVWGRIFHILPQSRLRLQNRLLSSREVREQMLQRLQRAGITAERVLLEKQLPRIDYLNAHAHIDLILDTFPFSGLTTTCEALWMGVPTMTLAGNTMVSRQGASLLSCAGLTDWIVNDEDDYVAKAQALVSDLQKLTRLRAGLREQLLSSPLFDGPRFARNFATALWGMWWDGRRKSARPPAEPV
jgi:protein O-GlcNAc transferase